jgi:DNA topoisomerase-3
MADWTVGINATRLFTKLYNTKMNIGRVQTPTLAMLCQRLEEIENFRSTKYHNVRLRFEGGEAVTEKIDDLAAAELIVADCNSMTATVKSVKTETKTVNPPKLYDLTTLQRESNRIFGYTAQQTSDYAQSLYESRLLTYPRTSSQYLPDDMADTANKIIKRVIETIPVYRELTFTLDVSRVINSARVNDHFALTPTAEIAKVNLDSLPDGERKILLLVCNKLLCATADKHEYEAVAAEIVCGGHTFTAKGKTVINDGWKSVEWLFTGKDSEETPLDLVVGQTFENPVCTITEHFTKPKPHYTEDTLLSAMNRAGAGDVTDEVERSGLGTPATRAGIIEKLIRDGYARREKRNIVCTANGAQLIGIVPQILKSPIFTAEWEDGLARIAQGQIQPAAFMSEVNALVREIVSDAKANVDVSKVRQNNSEIIGKCRRCGGDVREMPKSYSCADRGCKFALWKDNKLLQSIKSALTKEMAAALLKDGRVWIDGMVSSKTNKTFSAMVVLADTGQYVNLAFDFSQKKPQ